MQAQAVCWAFSSWAMHAAAVKSTSVEEFSAVSAESCSLFGIPSEIAMQVVAVGFIIGVLQDSAETALNSSTDVLFTAAACQGEEQKTQKAREAQRLA